MCIDKFFFLYVKVRYLEGLVLQGKVNWDKVGVSKRVAKFDREMERVIGRHDGSDSSEEDSDDQEVIANTIDDTNAVDRLEWRKQTDMCYSCGEVILHTYTRTHTRHVYSYTHLTHMHTHTHIFIFIRWDIGPVSARKLFVMRVDNQVIGQTHVL